MKKAIILSIFFAAICHAQVVLVPGTTSVIEYVELRDSTTGAAKTGVAATAISVSYTRTGAAASTLTAQTALSAATDSYTSGKAIEVSSSNAPGTYRVDIPDAAFAAGVDKVAVTVTATGALKWSRTYYLRYDAVNVAQWNGTAVPAPNTAGYPLVDAAKMSGTALTARDIGASVLLSSGTGTGQISLASGAVTVGTLPTIPANWITAAGIATDAITSDEIAATAVTEIQAGLATPTNITAGTITTVTNLTNLPTMPTDWLTAAGLKADAVTEIQTGLAPSSTALSTATWTGTMASNLSNFLTLGYDTTNHWINESHNVSRIEDTAASAWMTDQDIDRVLNGLGNGGDLVTGAELRSAVTAIQTYVDASISSRLPSTGYTSPPGVAAIADGVWDESQSGHTSAGTFGKYLDSQVSAISGGSGGGATVDDIWDEPLAGHASAGSAGAALAGAGSAGDPWSTPLPGSYTAGTAGSLVYSILTNTANGITTVTNPPIATDHIQIVQGDDYPSPRLIVHAAWQGESITGGTATFSVQPARNYVGGTTTGVSTIGTATVGTFNTSTGTYPITIVLTNAVTGALDATVATASKNYHWEIAVTVGAHHYTVADGPMSVRRRFN